MKNFVITEEEVEKIKGFLNSHNLLQAKDILNGLKPLDETITDPKVNKQEGEKMAEDTQEDSTSTEESTESTEDTK